MSTYQCRSLQSNGRPSIPLIISKKHTWNKETNMISTLPQVQPSNLGLIELVDDAIQMIQSIEKPIAVVSIFGPLRSGKSYILSRLLGRSQAFGLGHEMDTHTKGTWISTTVLENDQHVIVFLDTEGTDSINNDDNDAAILSQLFMVILMSSVVIYNTKNNATTTDLEELGFLSNLLEKLYENDSEDEGSIKSNLPYMIWLLRDFTLKLERNGEPISINDHISRLLQEDSSGHGDTVATIKRLFPPIIGATLCPPGLQDPSKILENEVQLPQQFEHGIKAVRELIFDKVPYRLKLKNGKLMIELLSTYKTSVQSNSGIMLKDMYSTCVEEVLKKTAMRLTEEYKQEMENFLDITVVEQEALMVMHDKICDNKSKEYEVELECFFDSESSESIKNDLMTKFQSNIGELYEHDSIVMIKENTELYKRAAKNHNKSKELCQKIFQTIFQSFMQDVGCEEEALDPEIFTQKFQEAEKKYFAKAVGPAKEKVYKKNRPDIEKHYKTVGKIPARPYGLRVAGTDKTRVKLSWNAAESNEKNVSYYEAQYSLDKKTWSDFPKTTLEGQLWSIIDNLDSKREYYFHVRGVNEEFGDGILSEINGIWSEILKAKTTPGYLQQGAAAVGAYMVGVAVTPLNAVTASFVVGPLGVPLAIAAAPVTSGILANEVKKRLGPTGDFSETNAYDKKGSGSDSDQNPLQLPEEDK